MSDRIAGPTGASGVVAGPLRVQNIGWDGGGEFMWAAVVSIQGSDYRYKEAVARFRTKADAEVYIALLDPLPEPSGNSDSGQSDGAS